MADPITIAILTQEIVLALIKLLTSLLERSPSTQTDFRTNLSIVKVDLGIVNDVLRVIKKTNKRKLCDGIKAWKAEAEGVVKDTKSLLERIDKNNPFSETDQDEETVDPGMINCWLCCNKAAFRYSREDAEELERLKERLDNITKHNATVLALLKLESRCFPL